MRGPAWSRENTVYLHGSGVATQFPRDHRRRAARYRCLNPGLAPARPCGRCRGHSSAPVPAQRRASAARRAPPAPTTRLRPCRSRWTGRSCSRARSGHGRSARLRTDWWSQMNLTRTAMGRQAPRRNRRRLEDLMHCADPDLDSQLAQLSRLIDAHVGSGPGVNLGLAHALAQRLGRARCPADWPSYSSPTSPTGTSAVPWPPSAPRAHSSGVKSFRVPRLHLPFTKWRVSGSSRTVHAVGQRKRGSELFARDASPQIPNQPYSASRTIGAAY
jgi:hypothetical protein